MLRLGVALLLVMAIAAPAAADWEIKPFLGATFGGGTTIVDLERAAGKPKVVFGARAAFLIGPIGGEADFGQTPGFFQTGDQHLVLQSGVTTFTGNLVVTVPRSVIEYSLRPYVVGGAGVMHVSIDDVGGVLTVRSNLPAFDVGGGVTGYVKQDIGINWDLRYFRSMQGQTENRGLSFGAEELSFWRATVAVALRY